MLAFDIGALHGEDAMLYLKKGYDVVSVEPCPSPNLLGNNWDTWNGHNFWVLSENALVPETHVGPTIKISLNPTRPELHSTVRDWGNSHDVPAIKMSELLKRHGNPQLLKMDIEGAELGILKSWATCDIPYLIIEFSDPLILDELIRLGYDTFRFSDQNKRNLWPAEYQNHDGSGPWGDDLKVPWVDDEMIATEYAEMDHQNYWADIHAKKTID